MDALLLNDLVKITTGTNSSRLTNKTEKADLYTAQDLEDDLLHIEEIQVDDGKAKSVDGTRIGSEGLVVQSLISERTAMMTEQNATKGLNQNFAYFEFNNAQIDPKYLCYMLNESEAIAAQRYRFSQGSVIRKATPMTIREFQIDLPSLDLQQAIGNLYGLMLSKKRITKEKSILEEKIMLEKIRDALDQ